MIARLSCSTAVCRAVSVSMNRNKTHLYSTSAQVSFHAESMSCLYKPNIFRECSSRPGSSVLMLYDVFSIAVTKSPTFCKQMGTHVRFIWLQSFMVKKEQTVPWVPYKLYPPTLSLEKWHHTRLCPQQTPRVHKIWKWTLTLFWFLGIIPDRFTSSEELFTGSFILAAPLVLELQFSSFTL